MPSRVSHGGDKVLRDAFQITALHSPVLGSLGVEEVTGHERKDKILLCFMEESAYSGG